MKFRLTRDSAGKLSLTRLSLLVLMSRDNLETTGDESEAVSLVGDMRGRPNRTTEPPFNEPLYKS